MSERLDSRRRMDVARKARHAGAMRLAIRTSKAANDVVALDAYVERAIMAMKAHMLNGPGNVDLYTSCTKGQYYSVLTRSKIQFNSALQDWVSFTLLEALTYGCAPLYPNHRSFPESLNYSSRNLYAPFNLTDLCRKFDDLLRNPEFSEREEILAHHDSALSKIAEVIKL